jgi:hypothetical protein
MTRIQKDECYWLALKIFQFWHDPRILSPNRRGKAGEIRMRDGNQ